MKFTIHNVGHGFCASLIHQNGNVMLWDCGHRYDYRPSEFLPRMGINHVHRFFVTNYDEDHISDLPNLREYVGIGIFHRNDSISSQDLRQLKLEGGPISPAMESLLDMVQFYTGGPPTSPPNFPNVKFNVFGNRYNLDFTDTNNLSLVTFLECGSTKFIIPGDVETAGWTELLKVKSFRNELSGVNVFIASHHGRENGYCQDVFQICHPDVVIFSDSHIKYATQQMSQTYNNYASGLTFNGMARSVLSTRNDGSLTWTIP